METEVKKKINDKASIQVLCVVALMVLAVISAIAVSFDLSPKQIYSLLGYDYSRCKGAEGCFAFCNAGNGDATIVYSESAIGMVDFGVKDYAYSLSDKASALTKQPLDFAVISHPHSDHVGGFEVMVRTVGVKRLYIRAYTPEQLKDYDLYQTILAFAKQNGVEVIHPTHGDAVKIGDITLQFYTPVFYTKDENERCLVTRATIGNQSCLFVGDSGYTTEAYLLDMGCNVNADILKVGHHGSNKGTSAEFLKAVQPSHAVICVGYNSYGHPSLEVCNRLTERNIPFYRTDAYHQIVFSVKGSKLSVQYI